MLKYMSVTALFPAVLALGYGESVWPYLGTVAITAAIGFGLERVGRRSTTGIGFREGYLAVSLVWLFLAAFGALPFLLSGEPQIDHPLDAFFESMSGFTTTGATILVDIEALPKSLLMWRQFTQWLGGMGIIVLALAVLPRLRVGGRQLLENELPGPEIDQLRERIRTTAQRLWILYIALTAVEFVLLAAIGWTGLDDQMNLFNAAAHAFTTIPTGGFSPEARSAEVFAPVTQWVLVVFMTIAGINFALTYRAIVRRQPQHIARDEEFRLYMVILIGASALLTANLWLTGIAEGEAAIRGAVFQVVSTTTTTGLATMDYALWPALAIMTLTGLMFVGASAGSTSGSVKIVRHLLMGRVLRREIRQGIHTELVIPVRLNGSPVEERTLRGVTSFILLYIGLFIVGAAVIAVDTAIQGPDLRSIDSIAVSASMIGNIGAAFGVAGPMGSFAAFSEVSKIVMILLMYVGRLEVIPIVILLTRGFWRV